MSKIQFVLPKMKIMKNSYYIFLISFMCVCTIKSGPNLTLFFTPEPLTDIEKIAKKLKKPGKIAKYTAKGILQKTPIVEGITAIYGGYINISDYNGELSFPRKHQKPTVDIIITPEIVPVPLFESTILHWKLVPRLPATMYVCEKIHDEQKNEYYWQTTEVPVIEDTTIPLAAVIIIAKPKNIKMDAGRTPTQSTQNLVLPNICVKKRSDIVNSAYVITIRHLLKPVHKEENRDSLTITTQIVD